jgi:hypothetical protein
MMHGMHTPEQRAAVHQKMLKPDRKIKNDKGDAGLSPKGQGREIQRAKMMRVSPICRHADHDQKRKQSAHNGVAEEE